MCIYIYMYIYPEGNGHNLYLYNSLCTYLYINLDGVSVQGSWGHTGFSDNSGLGSGPKMDAPCHQQHKPSGTPASFLRRLLMMP